MTTNANNLFNLYLQSAMDFAQTVVIKLDDIAQALNLYVINQTGSASSVTNDRTTWKYYQNISGKYHSIDRPMYVESLDGNGEILFSLASLASNPITASSYAFGTAFYNELIATYPEQEQLILGILYPCDIHAAVTAKEGTILAFPPNLVEAAEVNFINDLQRWVYDYLDRWVNRAYATNNNLFSAAYLGQLALTMVPKILNIRLRKCKTNEAHSFHIGQYLRSHGFLDSYINELTQEQILDFYRNINYYVRHSGTKANFDTLVNLTMQKRGLPIYAYEAQHNPTAIEYIVPGQNSGIDPAISFVKRPLNQAGSVQKQPNATLTDVFTILNDAAPGNEAYHKDHKEEILDTLTKSRSAHYRTKVVESVLDVTSSTYVQASDDVVLNQWLLLSASGVYQYVFKYLPPGATAAIQLNQQEAVALWAYAVEQVLTPEVKPDNYVESTMVPRLGVARVFKSTLPTLDQLSAIVDPGRITTSDITTLLSLVPQTPTGLFTANSFQSYCSTVHTNSYAMYRYYSYMEEPLQRAMGQMVMESLFCNKLVELPSLTLTHSPYAGVDWTSFLSGIGFNQPSYSKLDYFNLSVDLYKQATGSELNAVADPANIQAAMVSLLRLLSSYGVTFVYTPATNQAIPVNHPDVRVAYLELEEVFSNNVQVADIEGGVYLNKEFIAPIVDWAKQFPIPAPTIQESLSRKIDITTGMSEYVSLGESTPPQIKSVIAISTSFDPQAQFAALPLETQQALAQLSW